MSAIQTPIQTATQIPDPAFLEATLNAAPDAATTLAPMPEDRLPHGWSQATRIAFRLAFCYVLTYCLCNGNATVWEVIPKYGDVVQNGLANIFLYPAQYLAQHLFHVAPPGDRIHPTGSGDTAINWIACLLLLVLSLVATAVWSLLDRRRPHYQTLAAWLRFTIRLTLGFGMVSYGLAKVFPLQMPPPSIAALSEPYGMHSPMAILWNFIGLNPVYEMVCGSAELLGGLLLLFRRTALSGAIFTSFVVSNVLLYNLCFDVPVKLYAGHLLLLALVVILPDLPALFRIFWLHQPAAPTGVWVPPARRAWFRRTTIGVEVGFAALAIVGMLMELTPEWRTAHAARTAPCPLRGAWRIEAAMLGAKPHPVLSTTKRPFVELDINSNTSAAFRDDRGANQFFRIALDSARHTIEFTRPDKSKITFAYATGDATHLTLTPTGAEAHSASTLALSLASPPEGYPLLGRGFHWVSEFPYQR